MNSGVCTGLPTRFVYISFPVCSFFLSYVKQRKKSIHLISISFISSINSIVSIEIGQRKQSKNIYKKRSCRNEITVYTQITLYTMEKTVDLPKNFSENRNHMLSNTQR